MSKLVKLTFDYFKIASDCDVKIDYWSNTLQSFLICGIFDISTVSFLPEEELMTDGEKFCIILRLTNCTGNVIDLSENPKKVVTEDAIKKGRTAISIDETFKKKRMRSVHQVVTMVVRQHIISQGFFDTSIERWVLPITLK